MKGQFLRGTSLLALLLGALAAGGAAIRPF